MSSIPNIARLINSTFFFSLHYFIQTRCSNPLVREEHEAVVLDPGMQHDKGYFGIEPAKEDEDWGKEIYVIGLM